MPHKLLLNDLARDIISIVSLVITAVGFALTLWQLRKTKSAAIAAREEANRSQEENQRQFHQFVFSDLMRSLDEVRLYAEGQAWDKAALRLGDLSEQAVQLGKIHEEWAQLVADLRTWENAFRRATGRKSSPAGPKWDAFVLKVRATIDSYHEPFKHH